MPIERRPRSPVPRDFVVENSVRHRVRDGESWDSLAERYGVPTDDIIMANFKTLVPEEVNWYLHHYVGCKRPTRDGLNWMFSSAAVPGIVQIPPKTYTMEEIVIVAPPRFYKVTVEPSKWTPPAGDGIDPDDAKEVVKIDPWRHGVFTVGAVRIKGRSECGAADPVWANELIYYNIKTYPLDKTLDTIVVHHTDNSNSIKSNENREIGRGFAAIGYHFFIEKTGDIFEGRPLEVMGSHAGEGLMPGPESDPDFDAIGIVLQGDYHWADDRIFHETPPPAQLKSLEELVIALRTQFPSIRKLLLHSEVVRGGAKTVCPGDHGAIYVDALRKKLGL
jgi:hypothetical protein